MLLLLILLVMIVEARQALRVAADTAMITATAQAAQAALLEALVAPVRAIAVLDNQGGVRHLPVVGVLLVPPVIILDDGGGAAFLVLFLHLLPPLVRAIGLLYALGRLVQLPLLRIREGQLREVRLEGILGDAGGMQEFRKLLRRRRGLGELTEGSVPRME